MLCSPKFLCVGREVHAARVHDKLVIGPAQIDDWRLARRLSYLLWRSGPDEALHALAAQNKRHAPVVLREQVARMIADPNAVEFSRKPAGQWLGVRNFENAPVPNSDLYKLYDDALRDSPRREPALVACVPRKEWDKLLKIKV